MGSRASGRGVNIVVRCLNQTWQANVQRELFAVAFPQIGRLILLRAVNAISIAILLITLPAKATLSQSATVPVFAGVAYLSSLSDAPKLFPYAWVIDSMARARGMSLDDRLFRILEKSGVRLSRELAIRSGSAVALAFDGESVLRERIANRSRRVIQISAQLIVFDFREQQVRASFPVSFERVEIAPDGDDKVYEVGLRDSLFELVTSVERPSLIGLAANAYSLMRVLDGLPCKIQVGGVSLDSSVVRITSIHDLLSSAETESQLSTMFAREWITTTNYPLLPSARSHAVNGKMAGQFSDGRIFDLKIPDPDYVIRLDSARTRRKTVSTSASGRADAVGAYVTFSVVEPLTGAIVASATMKDVLADKVPALQETVDEWPAAKGVFESLFDGFGVAVRKGDNKWFGDHAVSGNGQQAGMQFHTWLTSKCALSH